MIKDFVKLKKYNLQSLVPSEPQKSSKPTASSEKTAAKPKVDAAGKTANESQTAVSTADTSDRKDTADKPDTGDQTDAVNVAETTSDRTVILGIADEAVSDDKTASGGTSVAEYSQKLGAELGSSPISTETSPTTGAGESMRTAAQMENNEN